ncbi:hypothetical protein [Nocardiopsis composta]|uniref:Uncharacterized protein n=1 Tax=Nocardiopsis composta TaxID=157465 RepID=A0A7W8QKY4_9ACTN|nr:hypothetical protein [Nocardiopsis composta]MBB5432343.1 hypothetical protein [Nocardiopsis composta]
MKYVQAGKDEGRGTYLFDPRPYLDRLPDLLPELPEGARSYASRAGHYDFYAPDCVKDLLLVRVDLPEEGEIDLRLRFAPNPFKHDAGLTIAYSEVTGFSVESRDGDGLVGLGDVMLDEVLPAPSGCTHEIAFFTGRIMIACADLSAEWGPLQE